MEGVPKHSYLQYKPDVIQVLRAKYNLEDDRLTQSIKLLEEWVEKQKHFTHKKFEPKYYEVMLIAHKGSLEKTKLQLDKLLTFRTLIPDIFNYVAVKELKELNDYVYYLPMPCMNDDYQRIQILKPKKTLTPETNMTGCRLVVSSAEYMRHHDYSDGFIAIYDFRDVNMMDYIKSVDWLLAQRTVPVIMEGYGARMKAFHVLSDSKFVELFLNTIKPFVSSKLASRFHVHKTLEELHQFVDKKYLPEDFRGSQKPLKELQDSMTELLCSEEHQNYMKMMSEIRTDESLRPAGESGQTVDLPGSFRTLNVD